MMNHYHSSRYVKSCLKQKACIERKDLNYLPRRQFPNQEYSILSIKIFLILPQRQHKYSYCYLQDNSGGKLCEQLLWCLRGEEQNVWADNKRKSENRIQTEFEKYLSWYCEDLYLMNCQDKSPKNGDLFQNEMKMLISKRETWLAELQHL